MVQTYQNLGSQNNLEDAADAAFTALNSPSAEQELSKLCFWLLRIST